MTGYTAFWKRYVDFKGVTSRKDYWITTLINFIISTILGLLPRVDIPMGDQIVPYPIFTTIFGLAILIPAIAITVRRLHDARLSGLFYLLILIPVAGAIAVLIMCILPAKHEDNPWYEFDAIRGCVEGVPAGGNR